MSFYCSHSLLGSADLGPRSSGMITQEENNYLQSRGNRETYKSITSKWKFIAGKNWFLGLNVFCQRFRLHMAKHYPSSFKNQPRYSCRNSNVPYSCNHRLITRLEQGLVNVPMFHPTLGDAPAHSWLWGAFPSEKNITCHETSPRKKITPNWQIWLNIYIYYKNI